MELEYTYYASPCGRLLLGTVGGELCVCDWGCRALGYSVPQVCRRLGVEAVESTSPTALRAASELDEYFRGERQEFDVPLRPLGTPFQQCVWRQLTELAYGATATYSSIAQAIGRPKAVRAVGTAIGSNPLSIFIPCHRVIGMHSSGGYAGGIPAKLMLLQVEKAKNSQSVLC